MSKIIWILCDITALALMYVGFNTHIGTNCHFMGLDLGSLVMVQNVVPHKTIVCNTEDVRCHLADDDVSPALVVAVFCH